MSVFQSLQTIFLIYSLVNIVGSARILCVYPVPYHSHQSVLRILTEELSRHGHELVVLTSLPHDQPLDNTTEINVHDISYKLWDETFVEFVKNHNSISINPIELWTHLINPTVHKIVDAQFSVPEMQAIIKDKTQHFDVILIEACVQLAIMITARFKAPVIQVSSFSAGDQNLWNIGAAVHPLLFPEYNTQRFINLSFLDKLNELYVYARIRYSEWNLKGEENNIIRKHFGVDAPTITELRKNIHMLFLNVHHIWDNNRPIPPSIIYMGALHLKEAKPMPKSLQTYFDSSIDGIVYVSLGSKSSFSDLPANTIKVFFDAFAALPYDVLIKWNGDKPVNKPKNVKFQKWIPQNDILHHPKLKVFITQGGLQSTDEAIAARVPLIAIPLIGDQWYNAQKYVQHGIGRQLDINYLDKDCLIEAISSVAEDIIYRENLARLSRIMEEQRAGGLQKAVYWTEYVAKHGALHLRSPLADASLTEYFMLDVLGAILLVIILVLVLLIILIKFINSSFQKLKKLKSN